MITSADLLLLLSVTTEIFSRQFKSASLIRIWRFVFFSSSFFFFFFFFCGVVDKANHVHIVTASCRSPIQLVSVLHQDS